MAHNTMNGKICMVTGANSGIGKASVMEFAQMGATVVMVCRDEKKGKAARNEVMTATKNQSVELMLTDLSSLDSVRKLAQDYKQNYGKLHVLVNNAGIVRGSRIVTKDGLEETFVVNYLSHFLLTNLLLSILKASAPSRVVNVTSSFHLRGHMDFADLQTEKHYTAYKAYCQSKLAQVLFTYELAEKLKGTGVTVNCVHPGVVRTHLGEAGGLESFYKEVIPWVTNDVIGIGIRIAKLFVGNPKKGAESILHVATSPELEGVTGKYFSKKKERKTSEDSYDEEEAKRLWNISIKLSGLQV